MPGVGAYFVLPAFSAAMETSLMWSGVSKSGSPAAKPQTSLPAARRALAFASIASVGDGETLRAQVDNGAGRLFIGKTSRGNGPSVQKASRRSGERRLFAKINWPSATAYLRRAFLATG